MVLVSIPTNQRAAGWWHHGVGEYPYKPESCRVMTPWCWWVSIQTRELQDDDTMVLVSIPTNHRAAGIWHHGVGEYPYKPQSCRMMTPWCWWVSLQTRELQDDDTMVLVSIPTNQRAAGIWHHGVGECPYKPESCRMMTPWCWWVSIQTRELQDDDTMVLVSIHTNQRAAGWWHHGVGEYPYNPESCRMMTPWCWWVSLQTTELQDDDTMVLVSIPSHFIRDQWPCKWCACSSAFLGKNPIRSSYIKVYIDQFIMNGIILSYN